MPVLYPSYFPAFGNLRGSVTGSEGAGDVRCQHNAQEPHQGCQGQEGRWCRTRTDRILPGAAVCTSFWVDVCSNTEGLVLILVHTTLA